jgi:hypothetical protein
MPPSKHKKILFLNTIIENKKISLLDKSEDKEENSKTLDTFFGIVEKPPSPLYSTNNSDSTSLLNIINNTQESCPEQTKEDMQYQEYMQDDTINYNYDNNENENENENDNSNNENDNINNINNNINNINNNNIKQNRKFLPKELKYKIEQLSEHEMVEIFKIIKINNDKYSVNKNGIFINLSTIKKYTFNEISKFILFCENNNKIIDEEEQTRDIYREFILEN